MVRRRSGDLPGDVPGELEEHGGMALYRKRLGPLSLLPFLENVKLKPREK